MKKRKKYSKEFKLDAVRLVTEQGYSIAEAARNLGLNANMLGRWKMEAAESEDAFRGNGKLTAEQLEIRRLKAENRHGSRQRSDRSHLRHYQTGDRRGRQDPQVAWNWRRM